MSLRYLNHLGLSQPVFLQNDLNVAEELTSQMFGSSGTMMSHIKCFPAQGDSLETIVGLVNITIGMAMFVADTWDPTSRRDFRVDAEQPCYKWYYLGLELARRDLQDTVQHDSDNPNDTPIPYATRDELKNLHTVKLWNAFWEGAKLLCVAGPLQLHYRMYKEILTGLLDMDQSATPELEALRAIILREFWSP
jgi:hypothetical protein